MPKKRVMSKNPPHILLTPGSPGSAVFLDMAAFQSRAGQGAHGFEGCQPKEISIRALIKTIEAKSS